MDLPLETQTETPSDQPTPEILADHRLPPPMHESERANLHATIENLRTENAALRAEIDDLKAGFDLDPQPKPDPKKPGFFDF